MGDRANVYVKQNSSRGESPGIYLYTHWGGYDLPKVVQEALGKKWRWDDDSYLTRIIFDVLTEGDQGQETGYGISTSPPDNEHLYIVVDPNAKRVGFYREIGGEMVKDWSFQEYIDAPESELASVWNSN